MKVMDMIHGSYIKGMEEVVEVLDNLFQSDLDSIERIEVILNNPHNILTIATYLVYNQIEINEDNVLFAIQTLTWGR